MKTAIPYNPLNVQAIAAIWGNRKECLIKAMLLEDAKGNVTKRERLGNIIFHLGRRYQDLIQMNIDYKLHFPYYTPNPIDWNRGNPTKVSTLKPVKL